MSYSKLLSLFPRPDRNFVQYAPRSGSQNERVKNTVEITYFKQFYLGCLAHASY